jgi:RNA polymerase sigma-54 factor
MNIVASMQQMPMQTLAVTPQLIQSIQVLQFNGQELDTYIKEQVEKNPLIRLHPEAPAAKPVSSGETLAVAGGDIQRTERSPAAGDRVTSTATRRIGQGSKGPGATGNTPNLEAYCAARISLKEHLRSQLMIVVRDPQDLKIGLEIIDSIEDDGYFRRDMAEMSWLLDVEERDIGRMLETVQRFDPCGVGARNLSECLRIQLGEANRLTPQLTVFLEHLPLLAACRIPELARICRVEVEAVLHLAAEIRKLNPRPGAQFESEPSLPALPDVIVRNNAVGDFTVELNSAVLPKVLLDREYYAEISSGCGGKEARKFVIDCWSNANWLVRNLEQRAQTILRVATEVVTRQRDFLLYGAGHLHPLNLKDVATALNMHESTVSRATVNKYVATNRGTFELKFFFINSLAAIDGGSSFSSETIRQRIKDLIHTETSDTIYSDDAIMSQLKQDGIDIARRTVAKYREEMHISSSMQRRRQRAMVEASQCA